MIPNIIDIFLRVEYFLWFLGLLGKYASAQWAIDDSGCRTPDRGIGNCISIYACQPVLTALNQENRPLPPEIQAQFEAYACGQDSNGFKVCCPSGPVILKRTDKNNNNYQHRNLNLLPKKCGIYDPGDRIVNGENAILNEFPWMALLEYAGSKNRFLCGGTIINKNYILTAAHCLSGLKTLKLVSVRVGEHNLKTEIDCQVFNKTACNPPVQNVKVEEIISHPNFVPNAFHDDIGLIRVATMNLETESARPVCLPVTEEQRNQKYDFITVTGWGVTNPLTGESADILQKVQLPVQDKASCTKRYAEQNIQLGNKQICAGGVKKMDSCSGDSGGPMLVPRIDENEMTIYTQQGIVAFGPRNCGLEGYGGVYTLVGPYVDWILDNIKP